jgi:hypothetical protein
MTTPELRKLANDVKLVTRPEYVLIVELDGKPIGISASAPNINEKISEWDRQHTDYTHSPSFFNPANLHNIKDWYRDISIFINILKGVKNNDFDSLRVLILGVEEEYRKTSGLFPLLVNTTFKYAIENGITEGSFSQLAARNPDVVDPILNLLGKKGQKPDIVNMVYSLSL